MTTPMALDPSTRRVPTRRRLMAWAVTATATVALRSLRLHRIERLTRWANCRARPAATVREVLELLDAIDRTSRWLPARVACLERSLAVVLWCGLHRRAVCWRMGVRTPPFAAHAWVEVAGQPVGELVSVQSYLPILTIDAP